jgi:DNA-binding MarR family transcriptional regulator
MLSELMFSTAMRDRFAEAAATVELAPGVLKGLVHLDVDTGIRMRDLATTFGCDPSYVTTMVDALEDRGWARREPHHADRRIKLVVLTPAGALAKERALAILYTPPASLEALSGDEQRQLRDLVAKLAGPDAADQPALRGTAS